MVIFFKSFIRFYSFLVLHMACSDSSNLEDRLKIIEILLEKKFEMNSVDGEGIKKKII